MAIGTQWSGNNTAISAQTLAAGASASAEIDLAGNGYDAVRVQFDVTDSGSISTEAKLYAGDKDGTQFDTLPLSSGFRTDATGTRVVKTALVFGHPRVKVVIDNLDGNNSTGTVGAVYGGRLWQTAA